MSEEKPVTQESNPSSLNVEGCVEMYIEIRDKKAALQEQLKKDLEPYNEALKKLEALLLKHMQDNGSEAIRTKAGTAYTMVARSATIKDRVAFEKFVIDNQLWELAQWTASKPNVFEYIEKHQADVPGVNTSTVAVIGVRRGAEE